MEKDRLLALLKSADDNFELYTTRIVRGESLPRLQMEPCLEEAWKCIKVAITEAKA